MCFVWQTDSMTSCLTAPPVTKSFSGFNKDCLIHSCWFSSQWLLFQLPDTTIHWMSPSSLNFFFYLFSRPVQKNKDTCNKIIITTIAMITITTTITIRTPFEAQTKSRKCGVTSFLSRKWLKEAGLKKKKNHNFKCDKWTWCSIFLSLELLLQYSFTHH